MTKEEFAVMVDAIQTNSIINFSEGFSEGYGRAIEDLIEAINEGTEEEGELTTGNLLHAFANVGENRGVYKLKYETEVARAKSEGYKHYQAEDIFIR